MAASLASSIARRLQGKVAVITGGASGIGESTANLFARHGAQVIVADVQDDKGRALCAALGPDVATFVHCDVTDESHIKRAVDAAVSLHGKLDIMFNNAGVIEHVAHGFLNSEGSSAEFARVMGVNVLGAFLGTKHAARVMAAAGRGSIVTMASAASAIVGSTPPFYTCSKHAVVGLTRSAAAELGRFGVRVNCVSPYLVVTPMTTGLLNMRGEEVEKLGEANANLKGGMLKAEDVAEAVLYLGSDESEYVSGLNLLVDGGFTVAKRLEMQL